jgi:hypothetical protein
MINYQIRTIIEGYTFMNRTVLPTLVGVFVSLLTIWVIHTYVLVNSCVDKGGVYDYPNGQCLLKNGIIYQHESANIIMVVYVVIGFSISFSVSHLLRKLIKF